MTFSSDYAFTSQPSPGGETAATTPLFPPLSQPSPLPQQLFSNNMHFQQHIPTQQQQQQQQQQPMLSQVPPGYTNPSSPFTMPMNYMGQDFSNFGASPHNTASYNASSYQQQLWMMPSRIPSGYADQFGLDTAPGNYIQPISRGFDMSPYTRSAYDAARLQQQQAATMLRGHPGYPNGYAPVTPPGQQQRHLITPRTSLGYTMAPVGQQLPSPLTASPAPLQGLKRAAFDGSSMPPAKRQATIDHNVVHQSSVNQIASLAAEAKRIAQAKVAAQHHAERVKREAADAEKRRQAQLLEAEKRRAEEKLRAETLAKAEAERQEELERREAEFQAEQARLKAEHEQAQQALVEAAAQKARDDLAAEEMRVAKEERERWNARAKELRSDPTANFHSYQELLEYFPLPEGQPKHPYLMSLLANRRLMNSKPGDDAYEVIMFAKEHWYDYLTHKDFNATLARIKKKKEERAAV
ncbi:hypothetical protein HBI56_160820 [Parastagonospora nodorum]|nr:hypothetical protein HBH53_161970 [Parastagonospora nodorum]KAH3994494.1 hypothetical protein HBI10_185570 [Parastagonospora nodorum]KAH4014374.1 hypothetical protein HBI13_173440 [Parastagonospora nodorum]KAH4287328.1 hypothetical protein HBI02_217520 [Parastagonospora nodorum]KAH4292099.1 hypothetical protein HBI01_182920 [Parastagonospora nodorum]